MPDRPAAASAHHDGNLHAHLPVLARLLELMPQRAQQLARAAKLGRPRQERVEEGANDDVYVVARCDAISEFPAQLAIETQTIEIGQ